ncbi:MAG: PBP1A family penicillin-binding protein [Elusimicrobia bacterium]|nr:PBP1A family penicillin-binding protein [Elusimicrobiota bacterium]
MKKKFVFYAKAFLLLLILWFCGFLILKYFTKDLPDIRKLEQYTPPIITHLFDRNGKEFGQFFVERRTLIPISEIPVNLQNAVLAIEDVNFFKHWGIYPKRILKAIFVNIKEGRIAQGASTITQQLAKVMFLTYERTFARKIREVILAFQLEKKYSKQEILQFYLNQIYFGHGCYGIASASRFYFNKDVKDLNLAECALLAGLPKAPNKYSPLNSLKKAYRRRQLVLSRMLEEDMIDEKQYIEANSTPIIIIPKSERKEVASYFKEYIRQYLEKKYGYNAIYKAGLNVYTTLDLDMQIAAEEALEEHLRKFDEEKIEKYEKGELKDKELFTVEYDEEGNASITPYIEGSLLAMEVETGEILAMVGGRDFSKSQFNCAVQAKRQPGSAFKLFTYTAAIDNGYTVVSKLKDEPVAFFQEGIKWRLLSRTTDLSDLDPEFILHIPPEKIWIPSNYEGDYRGEMLLVDALTYSRNLCAVDLILKITPQLVVEYARRMGIKEELLPIPSLTLGACEVTLLEMTRAFGIIANEGVMLEPYAILKIEDASGNILEVNSPQPRKCLSSQTAYIMNWLLQNVAERGTGWYTKYLGRARAGKTGTTNNFTDAWFIGFTPDIVCGVWTGYRENISLGKRKSGAVMAVPIWTKFMKKAHENIPPRDFHAPTGINFVPINSKTGKRALPDDPDAVLMPFISGTEPTEY